MTDPALTNRPANGRAGPPTVEIAAAVALLAVVGGVWWWAASPEAPSGSAAGFVGDRSCRECHPGESAFHSRSGHARTLRPAPASPAARTLDGRTVDDPEQPGVTWSYAVRDGKLAAERRDGGAVERFVLDYAFGSGRHATTFVTMTSADPARPTLLEARLTSFAHAEAPGVTPGQSLRGHAEGNTPHGREMSADNTRKCFACHTTRNSDRGVDVVDARTMIPNVSCERCHGPAGAHVEAARRGLVGEPLAMPAGPGRSTPASEIRLCGGCHRLPEMITPGSIRTDNPVLVRHQPVGLLQSACYRGSRGALACTTCHDPHARASRDRTAYEAACLACHDGPAGTPCPVSPASGCVDCHMPRRDVARGMLLTDHWIRKTPTPAPADRD